MRGDSSLVGEGSAGVELRELCRGWEEWAATASKTDDGWQEWFPGFLNMMEAAVRVMDQPCHTSQEMKDIELSWAISVESEWLASYVEDCTERYWSILRELTESDNPDVRWQAYAVLGSAGPKAEELLRKGLEDSDSYVRRRAILSLARLKPKDAQELAERFLSDEDPYIRQAARELAKNT